MSRRSFLVALGAFMCCVALAGQDAAMPDARAFLASVRAHMRTDRTLLSQYIYRERKRDRSIDIFGRMHTGPIKVTEIHPGLDPDDTHRRVIEIDGKPRDPRELERDDLAYRKQLFDALRKRERESEADRRNRLQEEEKKRRDEEAVFDDIFRIYRMTLVERQLRDGRPMIVVDFEPNRDVAPRTSDGGRLKRMKGRAWISEADFAVARVEFQVLEDISVGFVLGKLYKGTTSSIERRKVNDEVWLPAETRVNGNGRVLVRRFRIEQVVQYSDYQKFVVDSDQTFKIR